MNIKESRTLSFFIIIFTYLLASLLGITVYIMIKQSIVIKLLFADIFATLFVYAVSLIFKNASVYDPYWSVAPIIIVPLVLYDIGTVTTGSVIMLLCILCWGIRLTCNWAYTFKNLNNQDWRYDMLKEKSGLFFPLVSLFGIMIFPTLVVFLCILPVIFYIKNGGINILTVFGYCICITAVTIQLVSDIQLHRFRKVQKSRSMIIRKGLWKNSRHPNYLGEILMWWGVYIVLLSVEQNLWFLGIGAFINNMMFLFISIPMTERRISGYKEGFNEYLSETNMLIPFKH